MRTKNYLFLGFMACLVLGATSCRSKRINNTNQQVNNRQGPNGRRGNQQRPNRRTPAQVITAMDANKDGRLSQTEVRGRLKNNFSTIDTNNDGFLSLQELKSAPRPQRNGPRGNRQNQMR